MATNNAINLTASGICAYDGSGTFSGRTLTQPAAGITIANADGTAGNPTFALANDLAGVEGLSGTGVVSRTGSDTWSTSTITQYAVHVGDGSQGLTALALGSSGQVLTSNGAGVDPSWQDAGVLPWTEVTGTSQSAAVNNGYITNNAGLVTVTIPDTAAVGDVVRVQGSGAGGWSVAQNAGDTIHFLGTDTTTGVGGSLASTNRYDSIELICIIANTDWVVGQVSGNITIV